MPLRLKSLELHGYKTFASRTLFVFADTVTAIVGPNGSGKSNIADSLRWVLGEQSYSLLRGKKTEDMIFSGSEHRPRAGMAAATITFDNCDGWLPIDFSEVAITRRAYRDGQNEYLINGQRVRLKDVSELLAQSGLAERTYTIIGQGLVDAALALKAEERRRLFEEAAGIGLYRSRREEALRRLETTRRNLERVQDILAELQPRLRSLERQARRAQEYEQVKADLQVALREWYGYQWHRSQRELTEAREAARVQEATLDRSRRKQAGLDSQLANLRERIQGLRSNLNSWHRQAAKLHSQRETLSRDLAVAEERLRSLHEQQQNTQTELAGLQVELGLHQERLAESGQEVLQLQAELQEALSQAEISRLAFSNRQAERDKVEKELQSTRQALASLSARQGQLQARLSERQAQVERGQKALEAANQAVEAAEQELQTAETRQLDTEKALRAAEEICQKAEEQLRAYQQRLAEVETRRKQAYEARAEVAAELAGLKAQFGVLEQAEHTLSGYMGGTRLLLQAARQAQLGGVRGAFSNVIDVPAELEIAITAALGEYLDGVLLELGPEQALDLLEKESSRGVILPLKNLKPGLPLASPSQTEAGILGIAADLVHTTPEYRPVVDLLLGQVLVVRDRRAARQVLAGLQHENGSAAYNLRAVTLRGEVFFASGPILAGAGDSVNSEQTVLGRKRQLRELRQQIDIAEGRMAGLDERLGQFELDLQAMQAEGSGLEEAQDSARQQQERATVVMNQSRLAVDHANRQAAWQEEQRQRLQAEINHNQMEAHSTVGELSQLEKESTQARERLRDQNASLAALHLDEVQAQVSHWNTQAAVAERGLSDGKARQRERQASLERVQSLLINLQTRSRELEQGIEILESEKVNWRKAEAQIAGEIESFQALIEPAETELEALEGELAGLQAAETAARQTLSTSEHHHAQARISLARRQEALEALRRRIEDDFGLVNFEYVDEVSGPTPLPLEGMVEQLPTVSKLPPDLEDTIKRQRAQLRRMGAINPEAQSEYQEVKQRYTFLTEQVADLEKAEASVRQVIGELDALMQREFRRTFNAVAAEFKEIFIRLFSGGSAQLVLTDPDDLTNTGIDIEARLPGRRAQGLSLLSGGERSLAATALVFALLKVSPTPFCVLDEVDAMLDEANVGRFRELLRELSQNTQFVVVTHNRNTVQVADVIYGVTMGRDSSSQVLSLKLDEVSRIIE